MNSRSVALLGIAALALTAAGCQKQPASADPEAAKTAIKADEKKWNDEFRARPRDQEALVAHYAGDAYFAGPGMTPADGSTAIRAVYAKGLSDPAFDISFASDKIDVAGAGDIAYARGHFTEKYTDPKTNKVMTDSGVYLTIYKKQQDGSWKVVEDFDISDPATLKEVPPEKPATRAKMVSF